MKPIYNIHPNAMLGKNVKVGNFTIIEEDVIIGEETSIGSHVTILSGTRIGSHCQIFPGAVLGAVSQSLKQCNTNIVTIGHHTIIREYVTIHRGTTTATTIGSYVLLMAYVHIAHDCIIEDRCILSNATQVAGHVHVQHHAILGGMVGIHQFIKIGSHVMVASRTIVRKDIPPFIKVAREPMKYCGINTTGLKRRGFTIQQINMLRHIYYIIFQQKLPLPVALDFIKNHFPSSDTKEKIISFIENSHSGIIKKIGSIK